MPSKLGKDRRARRVSSRATAVWFRDIAKRFVVSSGVAVVLLGVLACGAATARVEPKVRVLLYHGTDPIRVGFVGAPTEIKLASGGGLLVGDRPEESGWSPVGLGPWRVGKRVVRGKIVARVLDGRIAVLNRVHIEDYVASTVGGEMSPSWPSAALRAQAVAARTYVLYNAAKRRSSAWDVRATAVSQVYRGIDAETDETRAAARATRGQILTFAGKPILAVFHSTAGGRTATAGEVWGEDLPYLRVVDVEDEDDAPNTYWRTAFDSEALRSIFESADVSVGRLEEISVVEHTSSGRVGMIAVRGSAGSVDVRGSQLRSMLGGMQLPSTLFEVRQSSEEFIFVGSGHGHGVGMSQWGARAMAQGGASYKKILKRFYPGARLEKYASPRMAARSPRPLREGVPQ